MGPEANFWRQAGTKAHVVIGGDSLKENLYFEPPSWFVLVTHSGLSSAYM